MIIGVKDSQQNFWAPLKGLDTVTIEGTLPDSDTRQEGDQAYKGQRTGGSACEEVTG